MTPTGKFAVQIGAENVTVPGVYTVPDSSAMEAPRGVPPRSMAIIASSKGGFVGAVTPLKPGDEDRILRSGTGAQMARAAFAHGVKQIFYARVDDATPATLSLDVGDLTAVNPGVGSRGVQAKTSINAARADALDLYLRDGTGKVPSETYRGIGPVVDVSYVGGGTTPTLTVTRSTEGDTTLTFGATGDAGAAMTIQSSAIGTVADLVEALNRSASWHAAGIAKPATPINLLDAQTVTFATVDSNLTGTLKAGRFLVQALLERSYLARFVPNASAATVNASHVNGVRINGTYEFFTGGSDGSLPVASNYVAAARLLEGLPVVGIASDASDVTTAAVIASHVQTMSGVKARRERWAGFGVANATSKADFIDKTQTLALAFSDLERTFVAGNLPYDADIQTNKLQAQPAAVAAAAAVAIKIVGRPEEPLTHKGLRFSKFAYSFDTEELEELLESGVMAMHFDPQEGRNLVVQGLTTYTVDANVAKRKLAAVDAIDYLDQKIRQRVSKLSVGKVADEVRINAVVASIAGVLNEEIRGTRNPNGVLTPGLDVVTGAPLPAWRNLVAVFDGYDFLGVDFDCNLVGEIAYVAVRPRFTPARIEVRG